LKAENNGDAKTRRSPCRALVSVKTTLVFLALFCILFFIGTIFPQSSDPAMLERYGNAGGRLVTLVGALELLDIFHSPFFVVFAILFMIHLIICCIDKLAKLCQRPSIRSFSREDLLSRDHSLLIVRPPGAAGPDVEDVLKRLGFRRRKYYSEGLRVKRIVCEKGPPFKWVSWLYHVCFVLLIAGFGLSRLFAVEGELAIRVGEKKSVALTSANANRKMLMGLLGRSETEDSREIEIKLEKLVTRHIENPKLVYPEKPGERIGAAWGSGNERVRYHLPGKPIYPHEWFSVLGVYEDEFLVKEKKIEANAPLRYGDFTFHQAAHGYEFDLHLGDETIEGVRELVPFAIPQMEGEFRVAAPRLGTLLKYDGTAEELVSSADLQHRPPAEGREAEWNTVGEMPLGASVEIMHAEMRLDNLVESGILSYRHDPGVPLLWIAGFGLLVLMSIRIYCPWYQLRCHVEDTDERTQVTISIRMIGLLAGPTRLERKLSRAFLNGSD